MITDTGRDIVDEIKLRAMAKINLALDVLRRRDDGYHEVRMVMQTVNIYDELAFEKTDDGKIVITTNAEELPVNEDNLIYKSARLLLDEYGIDKGLKVSLKKNIPMAAGMAGGSTDAACTFKAVNELFELNLSKKELMERAVRIGADVPYCILGGTALSEGIGEVLTQIKSAPECSLLVAKPPIDVSTKFVYQNLKLNDDTVHPDIDAMLAAINDGDIEKVSKNLGNVLESVTVPNYPVISDIKKFMTDNGALGALMSGSGPTVFGIFNDKDKAKECYKRLNAAKLAQDVFLTDFYTPED